MKSISNFLQNNTQPVADKFVAYILPLTAALIICRAFPVLSFFYYAVPFILLFIFVFYLSHTLNHNLNLHRILNHYPASVKTSAFAKAAAGRRLKTLLLLITAFGIWAAVTAAWSPFPKVSLSRAAYFFLITIPPVLLGYLWSRNEKNEPFAFLLPANIIVVVVSLYSLITSSPAVAWTGGHGLGFMGYAGHQNTLAAAIVFTVPSVLFPLLKEISERLRNKDKSVVKNVHLPMPFRLLSFYLLILIHNLYFLINSVSRAGLLTLIIMLLVFILLSFNKKTTLTLMLLIISASAIFFYSSRAVREFVFKTESTIGDRRIVNIYETIEASKNGGLFGIGYGISQLPSNRSVHGHYENEGKLFIREKMIGSLAVIEETGIVGLSLFLSIIGYVLWLLFKTFNIHSIKTVSLNIMT